MIVYFSGTGNSGYVAKKIAEATKDEIKSMNLLMKQESHSELTSKNHPFVLVCPTYAWRIPRVVESFIRKTEWKGSSEVYVVLTCGSETANAIHYIRELCKVKGWKLLGFAEVVLPDNYIVMFPGPKEEEVRTLMNKVAPRIEEIAEKIKKKEQFTIATTKGLLGKIESGWINDLFYPLMVHAKGFRVTDECVSCGKCKEVCPLNNIEITNGKPVWNDYCTHCMACINRCPKQAIEYKNRTKGKTRYYI